LGKKAKVRDLIQFSEIEIFGLDGITTETEVLDALRSAAKLADGDTSVKIRSPRRGHGGIESDSNLKNVRRESYHDSGKDRGRMGKGEGKTED